MSDNEAAKADDEGVEAILVKQVGSQLAENGTVMLLQLHSTIDEVFTFAMSADAGAQLADMLHRQIKAHEDGTAS